MSVLSGLLALLGLEMRGTMPADFKTYERPSFDQVYPEHFTLTQAHIDVIRQARLSWATYEVGAPQVDLQRPWTGESGAIFAQAVGEGAAPGAAQDFAVSMVSAMFAYFRHVEIEPGLYEVKNVALADLWAQSGNEAPAPAQFELTQELITLARGLTWQWPHEDEIALAEHAKVIPGPSGDGKRPYGDMSYFAFDVHRLLDWPVELRDAEGWIRTTPAQDAEADRLHALILPAAQVIIEHGVIAPGVGF
ncbi:MAG: hypothetical protein ACRBCL_11975 [Maritimibacter sp.]